MQASSVAAALLCLLVACGSADISSTASQTTEEQTTSATSRVDSDGDDPELFEPTTDSSSPGSAGGLEQLALFDDAGPSISVDTPFYPGESFGTGVLTVSEVDLPLDAVTVCDSDFVQISVRATGQTESGIPYAVEVSPDEGGASSIVTFWAGYDPSTRSDNIQFVGNADGALDAAGHLEADVELLRGADLETGAYPYAEFGAAAIELAGEVVGQPLPEDPAALNGLLGQIEADPDLRADYESRRASLLDDFVAERDAVRSHLSVDCDPTAEGAGL